MLCRETEKVVKATVLSSLESLGIRMPMPKHLAPPMTTAQCSMVPLTYMD